MKPTNIKKIYKNIVIFDSFNREIFEYINYFKTNHYIAFAYPNGKYWSLFLLKDYIKNNGKILSIKMPENQELRKCILTFDTKDLQWIQLVDYECLIKYIDYLF